MNVLDNNQGGLAARPGVYMIAPVKKFGRVGLHTNFIPNKHGGGKEGDVAELAFIWCMRVCVGPALFRLFQV